jgi:hypothetical protein
MLAIRGRIVPLSADRVVGPGELDVFAGTVWLGDDGMVTAVTRGRTVPTRRGELGYLRILSFDVDDHEAFVTEVDRVLKELPADRIIIDLHTFCAHTLQDWP